MKTNIVNFCNKYKSLIVPIVLFLLFLSTAIYFKDWKNSEIGAQLCAALAGAAVVAVITQFLLTSQTDAESMKEQNVAKFSEKLRSYNCFLNTLNEIVQKEELSEEDEANIQFQLLNVNLHTSVENSLIVCKNLNNIIRKLKVEQALEPDIWKELCGIGNAFHNELYQDNRKLDTSLMQELNILRFPKNFRDVDRTLAYIQDSLSLYPEYVVTKRIGFNQMKVTISILPEYAAKIQAEHIIIIVDIRNSELDGSIYFTTDGAKESIQNILCTPEYFNYNSKNRQLSISSDEIFVGLKPMQNMVECFCLKAQSDKSTYLKDIYEIMGLLRALWWRDDDRIILRNIDADSYMSRLSIKSKLKNKSMSNIYFIPVGTYFGKNQDSCYLVYAPLKNKFFLALPSEVEKLKVQLQNGENLYAGGELLTGEEPPALEVNTNSFVTLHLLLNEKCNFQCQYCYSAQGRSDAELTIEQIEPVLRWFLSSENKAPKKRTIMFMGGGEPVLSWKMLETATKFAKQIAQEQGISVGFQVTTNGSVLTDKMLQFLADNHFRVQISFEVLPDVQKTQRGVYHKVAENINRIAAIGIDHYIRSTITPINVDRIPEMVEWCHTHFPHTKKLSCQQVVNADYFVNTDIVKSFYDRYYTSFKKGEETAKKYDIDLRSSSSHLLDYIQRERFCYNLAVLTPYGTLTTCPDVSSPQEKDYPQAVFGEVQNGVLQFDTLAFKRLTSGTIHFYDECRNCFARWNCGSGCPSTRRVYKQDIFDAICNHYRRMLVDSLMERIAEQYMQSTGKDLYQTISTQLSK